MMLVLEDVRGMEEASKAAAAADDRLELLLNGVDDDWSLVGGSVVVVAVVANRMVEGIISPVTEVVSPRWEPGGARGITTMLLDSPVRTDCDDGVLEEFM